MFKREIKPLPEGMAEAIAKSIDRLEYVGEAAKGHKNRPADQDQGDKKVIKSATPDESKLDKAVKEETDLEETTMGSITVDSDEERKKRAAMYRAKKAAKMVAKEETKLTESASKIIKDLEAGNSIDVIVQKNLSRKMSKDDILKVIREYQWKKRMRKEENELEEAKKSIHDLKAEYEKLTGKKAPAGTSMTAMQIKIDQAKRSMSEAKHLDPVGKEDDDIDNDGDSDSSDRYLKMRRKAIGRAMKKEEVEQIDELSQETLRNYHAKAGADRQKARSEVEKGMNAKRPTAKSVQKTGDAYKRFIKRGKGMTKAAERMNEETEQIDEISQSLARRYIKKARDDRNDALDTYDKTKKYVSGKKYRQAGAAWEKAMKRNKGIDAAAKRLKEETVSEAKSASGYDLYHSTMAGALQHAKAQAEKRGYEVDMNDWDQKVAMGPRKPSKDGEYNAYSLKLTKNGKPVRQALHIQVTNIGNRFELNMYIQ